MICKSIKWMVKHCYVWNHTVDKMVVMRFLHLNANDDYNNDMGHVDVSDQLCNYYRFNHWLRMFKWWWSIFLWGFGTLMVNAYVYCTKVLMEASVPKKEWLSHYEFRKIVALAWINSEEPSMKARCQQNRWSPKPISEKK